MQNGSISARNAGSLIAVMIYSGTLLCGAAISGRDSWFSVALSAVLAAPLILVYCRIVRLNPAMDFYDIIRSLLGKVAGGIVIGLLTWFALHVGAQFTNYFTAYTVTIALKNTPPVVIMLCMLAASAYLARMSFRDIGRWSLVICVIVLVNLLITTALSITSIDFSNLKPFLNHTPSEIITDCITLGTVTFGETMLALICFGKLKKGGSPYKAYLGGLLVGAISVVLVYLRNVLVLGEGITSASLIPSYTSVRILHFGNYLEHIESIISINLILMGITKIAVCLKAAMMGAAKLLNVQEEKRLAVPVGLLALGISAISTTSMQELLDFVGIYPYYALPFLMILPLIVWVFAEIKARKSA